MSFQRAFWLRLGHSFLWYLRQEHAVIVLSRSVNHWSIMKSQVSAPCLAVKVSYHPHLQWWAPSLHLALTATSPEFHLLNLAFSTTIQWLIVSAHPRFRGFIAARLSLNGEHSSCSIFIFIRSSECQGISVVWVQKWVEIQAVVIASVYRAKRSLVITKLHFPGVTDF